MQGLQRNYKGARMMGGGGGGGGNSLQTIRVDQPTANINRLHIVVHSSATLALLYYRASGLRRVLLLDQNAFETLSWILIFIADLILAFIGILSQAYRWRPVSRTAFPERLPEDGDLQPIDIFICTADPEKEPTMEVMNTVVSAMCIDYPSDKLNVYLSDDGGSPLTLYATRLSYTFTRSWLPFCTRYEIETRNPGAYFASNSETSSSHGGGGDDIFWEEQQRVKLMYEDFKERVKKAKDTRQYLTKNGGDRLPQIEIIEEDKETNIGFKEQANMPLLVYISREKRNGFPHHYKAGALNVLLRVSSTMSNSPCILVLDCDMYMNNPATARQAMCFHLDPHLSPSLAFVQFPQSFHNISKNDIYCAELRNFFKTQSKGCDGLQGPLLSGTGFYIKRDALYGVKPGLTSKEEFHSTGIMELKKYFGNSNEFIASLCQNNRSQCATSLLSEATLMASCTYEVDTHWGKQVGFLYGSVVEDYYTGFHLHCRGWISTYCYPTRPAFLGSVPISFHDTLLQNKRWMSGLLQVAFSKYCPLTYGSASKASVLQIMCYGCLAFMPLYSISLLFYGTISPLCFSKGITLFPPISDTWFGIFAIVHASSLLQLLMEVVRCGGSLTMWLNELRFWMIISLTAYLFACINVMMKVMGLGEVNFDITNKVVGEEQIKMYKNGVFDFEGSSLLILPLTTLAILNVTTFISGMRHLIILGKLDEMFAQLFLSVLILLLSYPVLEGIIKRKSRGKVPSSITSWSLILVVFLHLFFG